MRGIVDDPFCDNCGEIDTIEHYFFLCGQVEMFWKELENVLNRKLEDCDRLQMTCNDVLFGNSNFSIVVNFLILLAKQFIVNQHYQDTPIVVNNFLPRIVNNFEVERCMARHRRQIDKFRERWTPFITCRNGGDVCNIGDE